MFTSFSRAGFLISLSAAISVPLIALIFATRHFADGSLTYSLDDAYIHLALAKNIFQGHYGLNISEPSSPSSSILWPFLMAPFAAFSWFEYSPLLLNILFLFLAGYIIQNIFASLGRWPSMFITVFFLLGLNFYGLVFTGMEHSLHVLLSVIAAWGVIRILNRQEHPVINLLFYSSLLLLPLVRYEGLAISVPVLIILMFQGKRRLSLAIGVVTFAIIIGFSIFILSLGLNPLPTSVSMKIGSIPGIANWFGNIKTYGLSFSILLLFSIYLFQTDKPRAILILSVTVLHFTFGRNGWFGRYEVYHLAFVTLLTLESVSKPYRKYWYTAALLPLAFPMLSTTTLISAISSGNIYNQHIQMGRIVSELNGNIAANDIGVIALRNPNFTLDLVGLASKHQLDEARAKVGDDWISYLSDKYKIDYAIIYDTWVPVRPENWIKIATLKTNGWIVMAASDRVSFYATSEAASEKLRSVIAKYKAENASPGFDIHME